MGFLARVMRFLILLVVLLWSLALLRRVFAGVLRAWFGTQQPGGPGNQSDPPQLTRRLVRDPVCGLYIPEERALALRQGEQELHFCSISCREKYQGMQKYAANG